MIYGSVCSGIEAATVAWHPLGWEPAFFSEIEPFPRAVLQHHYPNVPLHGDFTTIEAGQYAAIDLLVGGTPCQDFSIAGLRAGLDGDRGNLSLEYLKLVDRLRPRWVVWENVPGVLSIDNGRAFGAIVGGLVQLGYHCAYRILDAQYFGVPQRRRRVFLVGYFGDWRLATAVLFERESLSGHPAPSREAREDAALCVTSRFGSGRNDPTAETYIAGTLGAAHGRNRGLGNENEDSLLVAHSLRGEGFDASEDGTGRGTPIVPVMAFCNAAGDTALSVDEHTAPPITTRHGDPGMVAFNLRGREGGAQAEVDSDGLASLRAAPGGSSRTYVAPSLTAFNMDSRSPQSEEQQRIVGAVYAASSAVRRLTTRECERLQGFPDDYTLVPTYRRKVNDRTKKFAKDAKSYGLTPDELHRALSDYYGVSRHSLRTTGVTPDGPRYKALGNSMAVPCMRWIGERIAMVEHILQENESAA